MIAVECFKGFRRDDYIAILILSCAYYLFNLILLIDNEWRLILSFLFLSVFIAFNALLIKKALAVSLFLILTSLLTYNLNNFDVIGWFKVIIFVIVGIIFETIFLILKIEIRNLPLDVILGVSLAIALMPLIIFLLSSIDILINRFFEVLNLIILAFLSGLMGSIIGFLIWWKLRLTKIIAKFEYA